jgi:adenine/guanine phosphoribosyltransferase-like PRPP-binding protein
MSNFRCIDSANVEIDRLRSMLNMSQAEPPNEGSKHGGQYFDKALGDPAILITDAMQILRHIEFDSFVGTGLSGTLVAPVLARAMGRHFLIVRKDNDGSHSSSKCEGTLGNRWVFVDDFICSGDTYKRCRAAIAGLRVSSTCVGAYTYQHKSFTEYQI